ncbi:MAG: hypothetical protein GEV05_19635 [Betaproteobacteria bacterium]|nr:hypothetical protein [Betaproteobacteria bacterium]
MSDHQPIIVFALFPGVTQLDFTGPHEVFSYWSGASVILASVEGGAIEATGGMTFAGLRRLAAIPECDVVCVPGGRGVTDNAIGDAVFISELRRLAATAKFVTSVCTGSLALGAAGLLRGKRAACHWAWRELLVPFGAIPDSRRVVRLYVSGHSAGGQLTASTMTLPVVRGGIAISGIYDLEPIRLNYLNEKLGLDTTEAERNSPLLHIPPTSRELVVTYGTRELPELRRQSIDYAQAWVERGLPGRLLPVDGADHFTILEALADPQGSLTRALLDMIGG